MYTVREIPLQYIHDNTDKSIRFIIVDQNGFDVIGEAMTFQEAQELVIELNK
jgi:hypothetical protein